MCRVLFGSGHLSSGWLRFSKVYYSHSFHPISTKPYRKHVGIRGKYRFTFCGYLPNIRSKCHFGDKLPQLHCHYPPNYMLLSSGKRSSRTSRSMGLLLLFLPGRLAPGRCRLSHGHIDWWDVSLENNIHHTDYGRCRLYIFFSR